MRVIAEIGSNHMRRLGWMKKTISYADEAGADAVKFQVYDTDTLLHKDAPDSIRSKYKENEFPRDAWPEVFGYCDEEDILFGCTVYHKDDVDLVVDYKPAFLKISSFELTNTNLLRYVGRVGLPVILSTGMATRDEIHDALLALNWGENDITLLVCTSSYPARAKDMFLKRITYLKITFGQIPVGLSDHTTSDTAALLAVALDAAILEKHFMIPCTESADSGFSMMPNEFKNMVEKINIADLLLRFEYPGILDSEKEYVKYRNYGEGRCTPP
jgi:sialic acid synthase SpsE